MIEKTGFYITLLLMTLFLAQSGYAQNAEFGVQAVSGPDGVVLMIGKDMLNPNTVSQHDGWAGYNIYKREAGKTEFKKINSTPIARVNTLADLEKELDLYLESGVRLLKLSGKDELWQMIENEDERIYLLVMLNLTLMKALGLAYLDTDVEKSKKYTYAVTRVKISGEESEQSMVSEVTFGVPPYELKGPLKVTGEANNNELRLDWEVNVADTGVISYSVYRGDQPIGPFKRLNKNPIMIFYQPESGEIPRGAFTDTTAQNGRTYHYAVVSVDIIGNESPKEPVLTFQPKDDKAPSIPRNVAAQSADVGITVTWEIRSKDDLAGFNIYRSLNPDSQFFKINDILSPPDSGYYKDISALPNIQYYYRVTALDRAGNESVQSPTGFSVFENRRQPLPPGGITAKGTDDGILVKWRDNSEYDLRGYYLFRADKIDGKPVQVSPLLSKDTTAFHDKDTHLSPKGSYWYYLTAVNFTGISSEYSEGVAATPAIIIEPEPPLSFFGYQDVIGNRLFWNQPMDNTVNGYNIYRAIESDSLIWEKILEQPIFRNILKYTDTTAAIGTEYLYHIKSVNEKNVEGKPSHSIKLNRFTPPPLPPGNVIVTKIENGLKVSWDPTLESKVKGYFVYRRAAGDTAIRLMNESLPVTDFEFQDLTIKSGTRYFYSVS
ncbi:MAG: hypothetical protein GY839_18945, partial [candidate division Zixibacteria bacterium]|nr:hypothetical protein [candidate division Zixibacteria bacterium]